MNFHPRFLQSSDIFRLSCTSSVFKTYPRIFRDVQVRRLWGPLHKLVFLEAVEHGFWGRLWIIALLTHCRTFASKTCRYLVGSGSGCVWMFPVPHKPIAVHLHLTVGKGGRYWILTESKPVHMLHKLLPVHTQTPKIFLISPDLCIYSGENKYLTR